MKMRYSHFSPEHLDAAVKLNPIENILEYKYEQLT